MGSKLGGFVAGATVSGRTRPGLQDAFDLTITAIANPILAVAQGIAKFFGFAQSKKIIAKANRLAEDIGRRLSSSIDLGNLSFQYLYADTPGTARIVNLVNEDLNNPRDQDGRLKRQDAIAHAGTDEYIEQFFSGVAPFLDYHDARSFNNVDIEGTPQMQAQTRFWSILNAKFTEKRQAIIPDEKLSAGEKAYWDSIRQTYNPTKSVQDSLKFNSELLGIEIGDYFPGAFSGADAENGTVKIDRLAQIGGESPFSEKAILIKR